MIHETSGNSQAVPRTKPLLRGWLHAGAAITVLPLMVAFCLQSHTDIPRLFSLLIFSLSMLLLYSVSAIYHIFNWHGFWHNLFQTIDHANIFVLIAGTYTPICFNVLAGWQRLTFMLLIWLLAAVGVGLTIFTNINRLVRTIIYVGMGWLGLGLLPSVIGTLPWLAIALFIFGGVLYTVGGIIYATRWPNPSPRIFGFHEIFHLFVVAAGLTYVIGIWLWVMPFPRV
jgi:hemolysin III